MADKFPSVLFESFSPSPQELEIGRLRQEAERTYILLLASAFQIPAELLGYRGPGPYRNQLEAWAALSTILFLMEVDKYTEQKLLEAAQDRAKRG